MTNQKAVEANTSSHSEPTVDANRHQTLLAIRTVTIALVAGACTGSTGTGTSLPATRATTETTPHPSSTTTATSSVADSPEPVVAAVEVTLDDYTITPPEISLRGEVITISVTNRGRAPHDLVLISTELEADDLPTAGIHLDESDPSLTFVARTDPLDTDGTDSLVVPLDRARTFSFARCPTTMCGIRWSPRSPSWALTQRD